MVTLADGDARVIVLVVSVMASQLSEKQRTR
jgi:hypothetical protein